MELQHLVDKLSLQVNEIQEGFELLSQASSLKDLAGKYSHILRGNFLTTDVAIFHKDSDSADYKQLAGTGTIENSLLKFEPLDKKLTINIIEDKVYPVRASLTLYDETNLVVLLGSRLDKAAFTAIDKITLQIFLQMFDNAYQSFINRRKEKKLIFELNEKILQLNSLIDTGIEISKIQKPAVMLQLALQRAATLANASIGAILVLIDDNVVDEIFFPSENIKDEIKNAESKVEYQIQFQNQKYKFILANKESRQGIAEFNELDNTLIEAVTRQVHASLEIAHLHEQAIIKERIEQELNVAATIQQRIIPGELPKIDGYDIAGINIPSRQVGGDYYDCIKLKDDKYGFIIADVAGKGVPAALLVNTLNASLYSYLDFNIPLKDLAFKLNKIIYGASTSDRFITCFIAVLNTVSGELEIVNAGHNPILLLKNDGSIYKIEAGGIGLGMLDMDLPYDDEKILLQKGERLFLYTDGIPEAMNEKDEEYSDERMEEFFVNNKTSSAQEFVDKIVKDVKSFTGSAEQSDDITTMYLIKTK